MHLTSVLVPSKFIFCILQLILTIVIIQTREEYINSGLPTGASSSSPEYAEGKQR